MRQNAMIRLLKMRVTTTETYQQCEAYYFLEIWVPFEKQLNQNDIRGLPANIELSILYLPVRYLKIKLDKSEVFLVHS
jgi:hypothetical protein